MQDVKLEDSYCFVRSVPTRYANLNSGFSVLDDQQRQPTPRMSKIEAEWALF